MVDIEVERRAPFGDNPVVGPRGTKTQRRILTSALAVFAEHGYHDSSIEQITEAAGCSRPTFYQYFAGKKEVFRALASYVGKVVVDMTDRLGPVTPDAEGRAALVAWMHEFADMYDTYAPVFAGFSAATRADTDLPKASAAVNARMGKAMRAHLDTGDEAVDPDVMASIVVTMIVRANLLRLGSVGLIARERFIESLAGLIHRVLLGPVPGVDGAGPADAPPARLRTQAPKLEADSSAEDALSPQGRQMRARIIEAGVSVFAELGFHKTRVDDVVEAAGVSHGSFYRYFASKDALFQVLATGAARNMIDCIDDFPTGGEVAALRGWLDQWFALYAEHGRVIALWRETQFPDPALEDLTMSVARAALGRLLEVISKETAGDPLVNAMAFLGLVETVPHHVYAFGYFSQADAVDALVAVLGRGYGEPVPS